MSDTAVGHRRPDHEDCECAEELDHALHDCACTGYPGGLVTGREPTAEELEDLKARVTQESARTGKPVRRVIIEAIEAAKERGQTKQQESQ